MNEIPQESPDKSDEEQRSSNPSPWHPMTWMVIGFAVGTLAVAPLILSVDFRTKLEGGAIYGGILGALIGLAHGAKRWRKSRQS